MKRSTIGNVKFDDLREALVSPGERPVPRYVAVGLLEALWHFTAHHHPDGQLGADFARAARWMGWQGTPDGLLEALVLTGWIDRDDEGRLAVHDWFAHCDRYVRRKLGRRADGRVAPSYRRPAEHVDLRDDGLPEGDPRDARGLPMGIQRAAPPGSVEEKSSGVTPEPQRKSQGTSTFAANAARQVIEERFGLLWDAYPARLGANGEPTRGSRKKALAVWRGLSDRQRTAAEDGLEAFAALVGERPPDCERYLRNERWTDVAEGARGRGSTRPGGQGWWDEQNKRFGAKGGS